MKKLAALIVCIAVNVFGAVAASEPSVELTSTATNLIITETAKLQIHLFLPPLPAPHDDYPPFVEKRPPHITADFLEQGWKSDALQAGDLNALAGTSGRNRNTPTFTLNNYISNDIFSSMRDPFGMFNEDPFDRIGPRQQRFPFISSREKRNGTNVWHFIVETPPFKAIAPGRVVFNPVTVQVSLITSVDKQNRVTLEQQNFRTKALVLTVSEPPTAGRPDTYCGAIASNLTVRAAFDTNVCTAGDPLILTLDVSGAADLTALRPPEIAGAVTGSVFRVDAASVRTETFANTKRFTWRIRAVEAGTGEFPSVPVSFFNIIKRAYQTIRTETIPVQVKAGVQATLGADERENENVFPMPDGLDLDPRGAEARPLVPRLRLILLLFILPPFFFVLARLLPPAFHRIAIRRTQHRRATAFARCRRVLLSSSGSHRKARAARTFLETRYGVRGAAITAADAARLMSGDFDAKDIAGVTAALEECDAEDYAAKHTTSGKALSAALLIGLIMPALLAGVRPDDEAAFSYRRAEALAIRASDAASFRKAADAYADCVTKGAANPILFSNLAACRLLAGDPRSALEAYARAERYGGETAATRRGIRAAFAQLRNDPRADAPLTRIFLRPHVALSIGQRLLTAAALWAFIWCAALLPVCVVRKFLITVALLCFIVTAMSVTVSLAGEHLANGASHVVR